jgi:phosphohistidine phosphatase
MKLYVLRHGLALNLSEANVSSDFERPLAEIGRTDIRAMARYLHKQGAAIEIILSSPMKRALQTAEEAAKILQPKSGAIVFDPLSNRIAGSALYRAIQEKAPKASELLAVGHQPQLGEMVEHLLGTAVEIRPGGLVALEITDTAKPKLLWNKNP